MIFKRVNHRVEIVHSQLFNLIEPFSQLQSCSILDALDVINIGKFHSQIICLFQCRIMFKDDFRPGFLCFSPPGPVLGQYELCPGEQLLTRVTIAVSKWYIFLSLTFSFFYLLVLFIPCHPPVSDTHVIQSIIIQFLHMKPVIGNECFGKNGTGYAHHRR